MSQKQGRAYSLPWFASCTLRGILEIALLPRPVRVFLAKCTTIVTCGHAPLATSRFSSELSLSSPLSFNNSERDLRCLCHDFVLFRMSPLRAPLHLGSDPQPNCPGNPLPKYSLPCYLLIDPYSLFQGVAMPDIAESRFLQGQIEVGCGILRNPGRITAKCWGVALLFLSKQGPVLVP